MTATDSNLQHIAIIMDGNGRWARSRKRDRIFGHIKGARVAKKIVEYCAEKKLSALTLYAFSEENWGRPIEEVNFLMRLLSKYIARERKSLIKNNIRFRCIGQIEKLPQHVLKEVQSSIEDTKHNTGMNLTFALSYGGRQEITGAVKKIASLVQEKKISPDDISETMISEMLQTSHIPDPDLIIRTSGEWRLSNFLPWQSVYSELFFVDTLWPDFSIKDLENALQSFSSRERRYGQVLTKERIPTL